VKKLRIYLDTSVIGGCFDPEFRVWSESLVEDFRQGRYIAVVSDVTAAEIAPAPDFVKSLHQELLSLPTELIRVNEEAVSLVQGYVEQRSGAKIHQRHAAHRVSHYCGGRCTRQLEFQAHRSPR
jgi:hypothetical protein